MKDLKIEVPTIEEAKIILEEASKLNPGAWIDHSIYTGEVAFKIAEKCERMDAEAAKVLGMLHDIGRRAGVFKMRHSIEGYNYSIEKGYSTLARICITHCFPYKDMRSNCGKWDCSKEEYDFIENYINSIEFNEYDKLIQLCDCLALPSGFTILEKRMVDVALRYEVNEFTVPKWKNLFELKNYFEIKIGQSIYELLPGIIENTFEF